MKIILPKPLLTILIIITVMMSCTPPKPPTSIDWNTDRTSEENMQDEFSEERMKSEFQKYLKEYQSPLANYTEEIIAACKEHDCDPCLIIAIGMAETTLGNHMGGRYNFWNYLPGGEGNPPHNFKSWENAISALAYEFGENGAHAHKSSLEAINGRNPKFCVSGCEHWMSNVLQVYDDLSGAGCNANTDLTFPSQ